jgi:HSP20 family molecular chaperone IbpA
MARRGEQTLIAPAFCVYHDDQENIVVEVELPGVEEERE